MDSLSQIVLGAAVANAVAGRELKGKALVIGAIAGTLPDLDTLALVFTDHLSAVEFHRGITHSIFTALLTSFIFGFGLYKFQGRNNLSFAKSFWLFFLVFVTHGLLDVFTTWGTKLFWPLPYSLAFKSVFVVDPLYTIPFIYFLVRSARCGSDWKRREYFNTLGLVVSSGYLVLTLVLKFVVYQKFIATLDNANMSYEKVSVKPSALNTILWNAIIETPDAFLVSDYSFFDSSEPVFVSYAKNHHLKDSLSDYKVFDRLVVLSENDYTLVQKGDTLFFNDLRFGLLKNDPIDPQFGFSYQFYTDDQGQVQVKEVKKNNREGVLMLKKLVKRIGGR